MYLLRSFSEFSTYITKSIGVKTNLLSVPLRVNCKYLHTFTVCVEGNIGSGKSTLLHYLAGVMNVGVIPEPVYKWQNFRGMNLLEKVYTDPQRWAYLFQSYVQLTMLENHLLECKYPVKLMERSIHSARYCFVESLYRTGRLSAAEYHAYCKWYCAFVNYLDCSVDLVVYLRTDPVIAQKRIVARARYEEQEIPLQYCENLHQSYEEWIRRPDMVAPVLVVDANKSLQKINYKYVIETIEQSVVKSVL